MLGLILGTLAVILFLGMIILVWFLVAKHRFDKGRECDDVAVHDAVLRDFNEAWEFVNKNWGWQTSTRPDKNLKPVPYSKSVLHDFLESEGMTLLIGNDGNYYTVQDKQDPYGDYAVTEYQRYGRFADPSKVIQQLGKDKDTAESFAMAAVMISSVELY